MVKTDIQWTDSTVNFWTGCKKVSPGCKFCYMHRDQTKYGKDPNKIKRTSDTTFNAALKWADPKMIFTCSWSDFFIKEGDQWRADAWEVIRKTPHHTWQILTKRPERITKCLPVDWGEGWDNVWLGVSIEDQHWLDRATTLSKVPAKIRFLSAEPLIGPIDLNVCKHGEAVRKHFQWCIIGGESGNDTGKYLYRECKEEWIEKLIVDLNNTPVKVFVKQMGTHISKQLGIKGDRHGGNIDNFPVALKKREFPIIVPKTTLLATTAK